MKTISITLYNQDRIDSRNDLKQGMNSQFIMTNRCYTFFQSKNIHGTPDSLLKRAPVCKNWPATWFGGLVVGQFRTDQDEQYLVRTSMIKLIENVMIDSLKEIVVGIYFNKWIFLQTYSHIIQSERNNK